MHSKQRCWQTLCPEEAQSVQPQCMCATQRGNYFAETSVRARATIAELGARFIRHGALVLTHGHSRVVLALLRRAVAQAGSPRQPLPKARKLGLSDDTFLTTLGVPHVCIVLEVAGRQWLYAAHSERGKG